MLHALAPDRSDQPFSEAILPRRRWCSRLVPDAHGTQSACDDGAVDPIPIANEVLRSVVPRKCLCYLMRNPFCRRICCDVETEGAALSPGLLDHGSTCPVVLIIPNAANRKPTGLGERSSHYGGRRSSHYGGRSRSDRRPHSSPLEYFRPPLAAPYAGARR